MRRRKDTVQVTFRVPRELREQAEQIADKLSEPGLEISYTDVFRMVLATGIPKLHSNQR